MATCHPPGYGGNSGGSTEELNRQMAILHSFVVTGPTYLSHKRMTAFRHKHQAALRPRWGPRSRPLTNKFSATGFHPTRSFIGDQANGRSRPIPAIARRRPERRY